jgi:hypothetical protein
VGQNCGLPSHDRHYRPALFWSSCRPIRPNSTRSSGYGCISETTASRTAFSSPLARSSTPVVRTGIGCSTKPGAFDPCVPTPGSNGSAINQVGIIDLAQPDDRRVTAGSTVRGDDF